jgi:hypothetical protein
VATGRKGRMKRPHFDGLRAWTLTELHGATIALLAVKAAVAQSLYGGRGMTVFGLAGSQGIHRAHSMKERERGPHRVVELWECSRSA